MDEQTDKPIPIAPTNSVGGGQKKYQYIMAW